MHISKRINVYISIVIAVSLYLSSLNEYVRAATIFISSLFLLLLMHKLVLPDIEDIRPKEIFKNFIKNTYGIWPILIGVFLYRLFFDKIEYALFVIVFPLVIIYLVFQGLQTGWYKTNVDSYKRGTVGFNINLYFEICFFLCLLSEKENHCFFVVLVISYLAMGVILKAISYIFERNY